MTQPGPNDTLSQNHDAWTSGGFGKCEHTQKKQQDSCFISIDLFYFEVTTTISDYVVIKQHISISF